MDHPSFGPYETVLHGAQSPLEGAETKDHPAAEPQTPT